MAMIGTGQTFATYFAFAVDAICKVLWREGYHRGPQDLVRETGNRIRRLEKRFNSLVARWRAGTLGVMREVRSLGPDTPTPALPRLAGEGANGTDRASARAGFAFPRGRGWIVRVLAPVTGPHCVGSLCLAWEDPEMAELHAVAPQVGRILRPLAHMIGAQVPDWLKLPKRVPTPEARRRRAAAAARRRDERSELIIPNRRLPPREQAEDAMRRSAAYGKAIDTRGFSDEALGWFLHWPRDGNCPPPRIGYAGRRRRPPKDYQPPPPDE